MVTSQQVLSLTEGEVWGACTFAICGAGAVIACFSFQGGSSQDDCDLPLTQYQFWTVINKALDPAG